MGPPLACRHILVLASDRGESYAPRFLGLLWAPRFPCLPTRRLWLYCKLLRLRFLGAPGAVR